MVHVHNGSDGGVLPSASRGGDEEMGRGGDCGWRGEKKVVSVPSSAVRSISITSTFRRAGGVHFQEMEKGGGGVHGIPGRLDICSTNKGGGVKIKKENRQRLDKVGLGKAPGEGVLGAVSSGGIPGLGDKYRRREVGDPRKKEVGTGGYVSESVKKGKGGGVVVGKAAWETNLGRKSLPFGKALFEGGLSRYGGGWSLPRRLEQDGDGDLGDEVGYGEGEGVDVGTKMCKVVEKREAGSGDFRRVLLGMGGTYLRGRGEEGGGGKVWGGGQKGGYPHQGSKSCALHPAVVRAGGWAFLGSPRGVFLGSPRGCLVSGVGIVWVG